MPPDTKEISKENDPLTITRPTTWTESWMASPGPVTVAEHLNLFIKGLEWVLLILFREFPGELLHL